MYSRLLLLGACVLGSWAGPANAQAQEPPLTLQAALDEALANNPDLRALLVELEAERLAPAQERFLMPPMLEAQIWQWPLNRISPGGATYMFVAQQSIPGRGKRALRERLASADVAVTAASIPVRAREIVNEIQQTYAELFLARKSLDVSEDTIDLLRQVADASQGRYAAGRGAQHEVLKPVIEISRLHEERVAYRERARLAEARLNALLGRDPSAGVGPLAEPRPGPPLPAVSELQRLAGEHQPDLQMLRAEIERAEAAADLARGERRPDFVVSGGYMLMPGEAGAFTAGVGISWPGAPWSRKRIALAEQQAHLETRAATARLAAARHATRRMVQEAHIRAEAARERAELLHTSLVPQTAQALDVSRVGYQAERGTFLDIIDNQRLLAEARLGYYRALAELEQARADLERAVGAPFDALVPRRAVSASVDPRD